MMKKDKIKRIAAFACTAALAGVLALSLTACDNNDNNEGGGGGTGTTQGAIQLDKSTASVKVGETATVQVTSATSDLVNWTSSDPSVATVSASGNGNKLCTITGVKEGTATIKAKAGDYEATCTVTVTAGQQQSGGEEKGDPIAIPFNNNKIDGWSYWEGSRYGYPNGDGVVSSANYYNNGDAEITYSASDNTCPWTIQLRYNNAEYTGTSHDVTLTLVATVSGKLMVNNQVVEVTANTPVDVEVKGYVEQALYVQMGVSDPVSVLTGTNVTVSLTNVVYKSNVKVSLEAPDFSIASETNIITITDTKNDASNVEKYELGFFASETATEPAVDPIAVTSGTAVDVSSVASGDYTVRIRAINSKDATVRDSAWSTQSLAFNVANDDTPINATTTSGWYYDTCGGISSVTKAYEDSDKAVHIEGLNQWEKPYAFQLKLNTTKKITGISLKVNAENAGYLSFGNPDGTQSEQVINAGEDNTLTITGLNIAAGSTLVICFADNSSWWGHQDQTPVWLLGDVVLSNIVITYAD